MNIEALRESRGLTRPELAEKAGVDPATVWRLEVGKSTGSTRVLRAIARALGVSIGDLFGEAVA